MGIQDRDYMQKKSRTRDSGGKPFRSENQPHSFFSLLKAIVPRKSTLAFATIYTVVVLLIGSIKWQVGEETSPSENTAGDQESDADSFDNPRKDGGSGEDVPENSTPEPEYSPEVPEPMPNEAAPVEPPPESTQPQEANWRITFQSDYRFIAVDFNSLKVEGDHRIFWFFVSNYTDPDLPQMKSKFEHIEYDCTPPNVYDDRWRTLRIIAKSERDGGGDTITPANPEDIGATDWIEGTHKFFRNEEVCDEFFPVEGIR